MKIKSILITLLSGIVAGAFIGFGGFLNVMSISLLGGVGKVIGALVFSVGLILVCFTGVKLYTGRIGYVIDKSESKLSVRILDLVIMFIGNIIGAAVIGIFAALIAKDTISTTILNIMSTKSGFQTHDVIIRSFLCGVMVFLSVALFKKFTNEVAKLILVAIPVFVFVLLGFEHCVANGFYYAAGLMCGAEATPAFIGMMFVNVLATAIGNSCGSIVSNLIKKAVIVNG